MAVTWNLGAPYRTLGIQIDPYLNLQYPAAPPTVLLGDGATTVSAVGRLVWNLASTAAGVALTYHGYKRSGGRVGSALAWGILGGLVWPLTLPIAAGQGFGVRKRAKD